MIEQIRNGDDLSDVGLQTNRQGRSGLFGKHEMIASRHQFLGRPRLLMGGGGGGWQFQSPAELDPTVAVAANTVVYLSPGNPLVTTGLKDLVAGAVIKSLAGLWVAKMAVPAQVTIAGTVCYNVPQLPYPGAPGTPAGTPLAGDLDGANVFWVFLSQAPVCTP